MVKETCCCGATFHTDETFSAFAERMVAAFRASHRHEVLAAADDSGKEASE